MMSLRSIIAAGERAAAEEAFRSSQWQGVGAVAHRVVVAAESRRNYGWESILGGAAQPIAGAAAGAVARDAIGRSWDRALAAYAPAGDQLVQRAVDGGSRLVMRRPGSGSAPAGGGALGAAWDRALAEHRAL